MQPLTSHPGWSKGPSPLYLLTAVSPNYKLLCTLFKLNPDLLSGITLDGLVSIRSNGRTVLEALQSHPSGKVILSLLYKKNFEENTPLNSTLTDIIGHAAAKREDPDACNTLGEWHYERASEKQSQGDESSLIDFNTALEFFNKGHNIDKKHPKLLYNLGVYSMFQTEPCPDNPFPGKRLIFAAVKVNSPEALSLYSQWCLEGHEDMGIVPNIEEAINSLESANNTDQGLDAAFDYRLATRLADLSKNSGDKRYSDTVIRYLALAAGKGHPGAQRDLGIYYLYGDFVPQKNEPKAIRFLKQAMAQGDAKAHYVLGTCYAYGTGMKPNFAEAFRLFTFGSETYYPAKCYLAMFFEYGCYQQEGEKWIVEKDLDRAIKLYESVIQNGDPKDKTVELAKIHLDNIKSPKKDDVAVLRQSPRLATDLYQMAKKAAKPVAKSGEPEANFLPSYSQGTLSRVPRDNEALRRRMIAQQRANFEMMK